MWWKILGASRRVETPRPLFEVADWPTLPVEVDRTYVLALDDTVIPPPLARSMAAHLEPVRMVEAQTGHDPLRRPELLASVIEGAVGACRVP